jgi:hypothetical protein
MASSKDSFSTATDLRHLSLLIDNLTIDDQRILARILNNWEDRDQRKHPRTPCSIITEYTVGNRLHKVTMKNISPAGANIENGPLFSVSQEISQSFFIPNFEIPIRSQSKIIWVGSNGFGVQFKQFISQTS